MEQTATANPAGARRHAQGVPVGDYVGSRASEAAQAIRRAGLKPALERSFDCEPELVGHVVAQEPEPGSALGRNSMVKLYVGAPGDEPTGSESVPDSQEAEPASEGVTAIAEPARRRRKPGLAAIDGGGPEPPPPPSPAASIGSPSEEFAEAQEPDAEQLAERAGELFAAGGRGFGRRSARARLETLRGIGRRRPRGLAMRAAVSVSVLLVAVGLASALGSRGGERSASQPVHEGSRTDAPRRPSAAPYAPPTLHGAERRPRRRRPRRAASPHARSQAHRTPIAHARHERLPTRTPTASATAPQSPSPTRGQESEFSP